MNDFKIGDKVRVIALEKLATDIQNYALEEGLFIGQEAIITAVGEKSIKIGIFWHSYTNFELVDSKFVSRLGVRRRSKIEAKKKSVPKNTYLPRVPDLHPSDPFWESF